MDSELIQSTNGLEAPTTLETKRMVYGKGNPGTKLTEPEVFNIISSGTPKKLYRGKRLVDVVRKELESCGLDPWCVEKRRGGTRLQVASVELA